VSTALRELLIRHVDAGTIPGGVALLGAGNVEVVTAGVASIGGGPMGEDAIMRIQSMTKAITSVAALRLVEAGCLELDQSLVVRAAAGARAGRTTAEEEGMTGAISVPVTAASRGGRRDRSAPGGGRRHQPGRPRVQAVL